VAQSPTWGRPAPQVRVGSQFRYSKFLSQQWQMANDYENCILEPTFKLFYDYIFGGPPSPLGCVLASLGQSIARVKIWGRNTPLRAEIQSPEKCALRWVIIHVNNFFVCGPKFATFFRLTSERSYTTFPTLGEKSWSTMFPIFDLWIRFGDIRDQSRKLSEIAPDFGRFFCHPKF